MFANDQPGYGDTARASPALFTYPFRAVGGAAVTQVIGEVRNRGSAYYDRDCGPGGRSPDHRY
jgi:hypothetical protein